MHKYSIAVKPVKQLNGVEVCAIKVSPYHDINTPVPGKTQSLLEIETVFINSLVVIWRTTMPWALHTSGLSGRVVIKKKKSNIYIYIYSVTTLSNQHHFL